MSILITTIRLLLRLVGNLFRRLGKAPEFVSFTLEDPLPEMAPPRPPFPKRLLSRRKPSLRDLGRQLRHVAGDPRVRGVVLHLRSGGGMPAQLQSLRDLIAEVRKAGKRVVVWALSYDLSTLYVASAADEILLQPGGIVAPLGLSQSYLFLADALERVGLQGDFVQISPYKTAGDLFTRREMSEEAREMATWLIEDLYDQFVGGIATGRGATSDEVKALIDRGLFCTEDAVEAGLADGIVGEEDLPARLASGKKPARIVPYAAARRRLLQPPVSRGRRFVALLRIAGDIVDGKSAQPPFRPPFRVPFLFNERAGDLTVVQQARFLARNKRAAALVVHVDSGGGSAAASEAMSAALRKVAEKKPVVVSMGSVAASGGYYVATPGARILAQPGTVTGSIGVLAGKFVDAGLYERLLVNRKLISRGEHAQVLSGAQPFSAEERRNLFKMIEHTYELFLDRVGSSRSLERDAIDAVGGGRVWTGAQALDRGLVDELGGLDRAIECALELAKLPGTARVCEVKAPKNPIAPPATSGADVLEYALDGLRLVQSRRSLCLCPLIPWETL